MKILRNSVILLFVVFCVEFMGMARVSASDTPKWIQMENVQLVGVKAGEWTLRFSLYDDLFLSNKIWSEDISVKVVKVLRGGHYVPIIKKVVLGNTNPLQGMDFNQQVYLDISNPRGVSVAPIFPVDSQHVKAGVMPYALHCVAADSATSWIGVFCPDGQYLRGFDSAGNPDCRNIYKSISCPEGECLNGIDSSGNPICVLCGSVKKGFEYISTPMTWNEAENYCETHGGHLATIASDSENTALLSVENSFDDAWLGGFRTGSGEPWQWITGEVFSYTRWTTGEPNNPTTEHCIQIYGNLEVTSANRSKWNNDLCSRTFPFFCEY